MTSAHSRRLAELERSESEKRSQASANTCDLSHWTNEQLEAAALMLADLPDDTRLTREQVEKIMAGDYETT
jgi:hypothetical protein